MEILTVALSGVAAVTGIIGIVFAWKQSEHLRLPAYRHLSSDERDLLKAMHETGTFIVPAFNTAELMPFIVHRADIDPYGVVNSSGLEVSGHYYEACLRLKDRGIVRKPESNINTNVEYELTPKGRRLLCKLLKILCKHSNHGRFRDQVAFEKQRRSKPNTIHATAHDCIGSDPLGSTSETECTATVIEYPLISRTSNRICDVILPNHVDHLQVGDELYLRFHSTPLFLANDDWLQVTVTKIKEDGGHRIFICGEDVAWTADSPG